MTSTTSLLLISAQSGTAIWKWQSSGNWVKGIEINPELETSYSTQYLMASLQYVENKYTVKHQGVHITDHLVHTHH
jgi:hypothetical protein